MDVAFAINSSYVQHFFVVLKSIEINSPINEILNVHIMYLDLADEEIQNIKSHFNSFNIFWYNLEKFDFTNFFVNAHINYETYFRIIAAEIISAEKILYLDSDIIVRKPLNSLYNIMIEPYAIAGAFDYKAQNRKQDLGIPEVFHYFNAGVVLMNLKYWRTESLTTKLTQFICDKGTQLIYWDQDALNALLYEHVLIIDDIWNLQSVAFEIDRFTDEKKTLFDPAIVHFTGATKPWHISSDNPFRHEYFEYLRMTPYKNYNLVTKYSETIIRVKRHIYIWGAGPTGQSVYQYLGIQIKGFIDSDRQRVGQFFNNILIYSIDQIEKKDDIGILICSGHYREIASILRSRGFKENIDFSHQM